MARGDARSKKQITDYQQIEGDTYHAHSALASRNTDPAHHSDHAFAPLSNLSARCASPAPALLAGAILFLDVLAAISAAHGIQLRPIDLGTGSLTQKLRLTACSTLVAETGEGLAALVQRRPAFEMKISGASRTAIMAVVLTPSSSPARIRRPASRPKLPPTQSRKSWTIDTCPECLPKAG